MTPRRTRGRGLVVSAAAVGGLIIGLLVVATVSGERQPPTYRPFFAGMQESRTQNIRQDGPVLIPDPKGGDRTFYLDLEGDDIIALHVVPPGGSARCLVQYDHTERRYEDCEGRAVARESLARFKVLTRVDDKDRKAIYVDLRQLTGPVTSRS
jgi:hypothetical protein